MPEILSALGMLLLFGLVLFLAYAVTKLIGKRYGGGSFGMVRTGNIKVLDRMVLAPDRMLYIVEVAGKTMLLGVTQQHVEKICDIDPDSLSPLEAKPIAFSDTLKNVLKENWGFGGREKTEKKEGPHE